MNYHTNIILPSPIFIILWKIISGQKSATTKTIRNFVIETTGDLIDEKEIRSLVDEKCGRYSSPHIIKFIDKLPYTNIGKVDVLKLEEMSKD